MNEAWRISQNWRLQPARYGTGSGGLRGSICPEGHPQFPPREICPECSREQSSDIPIELSPAITEFLESLIDAQQDSL